MTNESGLVPVGRAVLVKPYMPERKESMIVLPDAVATSHQTVDQRAVVIEIGPECWKEEGVPRAAVGDKVLISAYAGYMCVSPLTGEQFRFVNDRDLFAKIVDELP
jgi:co-chaperonin GroES (HSP10)